MTDRPSAFDPAPTITGIKEYDRMNIVTAVKDHIESQKAFASYQERDDGFGAKALQEKLDVWLEGLDQKIPEQFQKIYNTKMNG